uniref:Uncharacterized protein n=1 Tax=Arundo donax TaxID=35708 RepID=A0A0A9BZ76_ARUDO
MNTCFRKGVVASSSQNQKSQPPFLELAHFRYLHAGFKSLHEMNQAALALHLHITASLYANGASRYGIGDEWSSCSLPDQPLLDLTLDALELAISRARD